MRQAYFTGREVVGRRKNTGFTVRSGDVGKRILLR